MLAHKSLCSIPFDTFKLNILLLNQALPNISAADTRIRCQICGLFKQLGIEELCVDEVVLSNRALRMLPWTFQ